MVIAQISTGIGCGNIQWNPKSCQKPDEEHKMLITGSVGINGDPEKDCACADPTSSEEVYCFVALGLDREFLDESRCWERKIAAGGSGSGAGLSNHIQVHDRPTPADLGCARWRFLPEAYEKFHRSGAHIKAPRYTYLNT